MAIHASTIVASVCLTALAAIGARAGLAQEVAHRSPNFANTWAPTPGVVQLNFTHRFDMSEPPLRKLTNTPTFQVATGVTPSLGVGFTYGSNSDLVPAYPNEWELFTRWTPISRDGDAGWEGSVQAGWNVAAESFDTEVSAARTFGRVRVIAAGRAFHHAFYEEKARYAVAGGAALRLSSWFSLAADYATLLDRADAERTAWGAGLQLSVPHTPHSMSVHATNVGTGSMEGSSRGSRTRWGFEYTVPITLRRYAPSHSSPGTAGDAESGLMSRAMSTPESGSFDTIVVTIRQFKYEREKITVNAGDVVVWRNADQVEHTLTADGGGFESPLIKPGQQWSFRFTDSGTFTYHCMPHPFMKAEVQVRKVKP